MSEDYSHTPSSTEYRSDYEPQPYADVPLPYMERPSQSPHKEQSSPSFHEQSSPSVQQSAPLPEEAQLAAAYQLGNVRKRYKRGSTAFTTDDFPSAPITGGPSGRVTVAYRLIPVLLIITLVIWVTTRTPPWPLILICLLILAPWLSNVIGRLPADIIAALQNTAFYVCTNGLMIIKWRRVQAIRWEQIQAIQRCRTQNTQRPSYILYLSEGMQMTLHWSLVGAGIKELGETIEHEISQRLLPAAIADYEAGQILNFGSITVTAQGLTREDEQQSLPWERFATIDYYYGYSFTIKEGAFASTWQEIEVESMLNFCVFLPLITHIKNNLHTSAYKSNGAHIRETVEERVAPGYDAYDDFQEQLFAQEEERERRVHEESLKRSPGNRRNTPIPEEVIKALRILDLPSDVSIDMVHQRYRQLAKRSHPDTGGDPETFKRINAAYTCVITWMTSQDQGNT